jgi:hypothetical protein
MVVIRFRLVEHRLDRGQQGVELDRFEPHPGQLPLREVQGLGLVIGGE